jgi:RNA polymerase sigma factor (sigma-70 family)
MKRPPRFERRPRKGHYLAAMVLGTALSTIGSSSATSAPATAPDASCVNDISRYCTVCWRNARLSPDSWSDCTQEVLCRLLATVPSSSWDRLLADEGEERREFIRAIDTVKKRGQRARKWMGDSTTGVADTRSQKQEAIREGRTAVSEVAGQILTPRQQGILQLCFDGYTVAEVSEKLGLPPERVSDEKYKAIRKLRDHFCPDDDRPDA